MTSKYFIGIVMVAIAVAILGYIGLQALDYYRNPEPHVIETTLDDDSELYFSATRTRTLFAGDCIGLIWDNKFIQSTFVNDIEVFGYGEFTHCDGTSPAMRVLRWDDTDSDTFIMPRETLFEQPTTLILLALATGLGLAGMAFLQVGHIFNWRWLQMPLAQYPIALLLAIGFVIVIDLFTNSLNINKFHWDHTHYIDMAENGITDNLGLVAPYNFRPATPLLANEISKLLGRSFIAGFRMVAYAGAISQLFLVFVLAKHFTRRFSVALLAMSIIAFSAFNIKFLLFDIYRPDHLAYPLLILAVLAVFKRNILAVLIISVPGILVREFLVIPPMLLFYNLARDIWRKRADGPDYRKLAGIAILVAATAVAVILPRQLIYTARSSQIINPFSDPNWLGDLVSIPLNLARDYNLLLGLLAFCLPVLVLATPARLKQVWQRLDGYRDILILYTVLVLGLAVYGGTDIGRFMAYLFIPLVIVLTLLLDEADISPLEILYMLVVTLLYNRMISAIPMTSVEAYQDFYAAHNDTINTATWTRTLELVCYLGLGWLLARVMQRFQNPRKHAEMNPLHDGI